MQNIKKVLHRWLPILAGCVLLLTPETRDLLAQTSGELRFLRVGSLNSFFGARAAEPEYPRHSQSSGLRQNDGFWWPAEYGDALSSFRAKGFNIGTTDFMDPVLKIEAELI